MYSQNDRSIINLSDRYQYTFKWINKFECHIILISNFYTSDIIMDCIRIQHRKDKQLYRAVYWNSQNGYESKSLKCWFNPEYLKDWIEQYIMSKKGILTNLNRLIKLDRYNVIADNYITYDIVYNLIHPAYTTDDDRV